MDVHPPYGEEPLLAQLAIAKHLFTQVAQLDIECAVLQQAGERLEHHTEVLGTAAIVAIDANVGI